MKNMNDKKKKWLTVVGCLALCAVLVVLIGQQFKTQSPVDTSLPPQSPEVSDVTVDSKEPNSTEKEKEVIVTPPDSTQPASADNGAVSSGTEQTIQGDVSKPEYTEEQLTNPAQKPNGEKVTEPPKTVEHDKVEPPKEVPKTEKQPQGGGLPGFDNVQDGGDNQVINADDMYENGNKIGNMN
ncbi:DUF6550 family protein [Erysipelothrix anatis]|uniref:DUF6550 family protein n=1 Tax=Erysipelothrix anatis TaxID=2683713 RepID=UPI00140A2397|nr:DUF6550 family protein [Erysipelothrix anatis]